MDRHTPFADNARAAGLPAEQKRQSGVSILEVVIALTIFGIAVGAACGLIVGARTLADNARNHYTAINLAKNRLERAGALGFDVLPLFQESGTLVDKNGNIDPNGNFRRTTTVTDVKSNLRELTVHVEIRNRTTLQFDGEAETIKTYHAKYAERPAR
ncbi:MAG: prepilin-type N-terminal cleavage/methylation domain-containing protein [Kiritimatiellae bacterium]|nr:prepilin-type N-terminal cleavage/methylation domain-containing protein [Kiritimatiellia bacterium]